MRRAKIVATIGPATCSPEQLRALILAGMNVARVNMSHGSHQTHAEVIHNARLLSAEVDHPLAFLLDLSGPKIRTGALKDHRPIQLQTGQRFTITTQEIAGDSSIVSTSYSLLPQDVKIGDSILLADGSIELRIEKISGSEIICRVINGGELGENKGINLPGVKISIPSLTEKDHTDLRFGLEQKVDYIALSFVRSAQDCVAAKELIASLGFDLPLIAKIEKREALDDLERIIEACDGVMVARGDLGVETAVESVPFHQKQIIAKANAAEKFVITATQMLESMTGEPRPTRAEASDVANAVLDGSDALMLSAETATGAFPIRTVETMSRIICYTESYCIAPGMMRDLIHSQQSGREGRAIAEAAIFATEELRAKLIIVLSKSGTMARQISALRPGQRIIAFTPHEKTYRSLAVIWGIEPYMLDFSGRGYELLTRVDEVLIGRGLAIKGETVVVMAGRIPEQPSLSSMMKLHKVGEIEPG
jgi:pyruvate kinase